jgi:hypothetical protein
MVFAGKWESGEAQERAKRRFATHYKRNAARG